MAFFIGCAGEKINEAPATSYILQVVDSVQVDYLGRLHLLAVHPEKDLLLLHDYREKVILVDRDGNELSSYERSGEDPEGVGRGIASGAFLGDAIALSGGGSVNLYDLDFNFVKQVIKKEKTGGMFFSGFDFLKPLVVEGKSFFLTFSGGPLSKYNPQSDPGYYQNFHTFEQIDINEGTFTKEIPFYKSSRYLMDKSFNFLWPFYAIQGSEVHFVFHTDTTLFSYDFRKDGGGFTKAESIPFENFVLERGKGFDEGEAPGPRESYGTISGYFKSADFEIVVFRPGIAAKDMPTSELTREEYQEFAKSNNPVMYMLRRKDQTWESARKHPGYFTLARMDDKGRLWANQVAEAFDEEPEKVTFYQVELVEN